METKPHRSREWRLHLFSRRRLLRPPHLASVSLEKAAETQHDGGGEDPADDDEAHAPNLRGTVRDPGIAHVEADDRKQEVEGIEERLEGWLDGRLVGRGQVPQGEKISKEVGAQDQQPGQPEHGLPRAIAVPHQGIEDIAPNLVDEVAFGGPAALLSNEDAPGVLVTAGGTVDGSELLVDLRGVAALIPE